MEIRAIADNIARWLLVGLVALTPFFVIPTSWATIVQSKFLLAGVLVSLIIVAYVVARLAQGKMLLPRNAVLYAAALLPVGYLASAILSGSSADSYASGLGAQDTVASIALLFAALALSAVLFAGGVRNVLVVFLAFLGGCSVVVLFQIARLFFPSELTLGGAVAGSASSIFGSWHDLGTLAALVVFFAVALFEAPFLGRRISKVFLPFLAVLSFFLIVVIAAADIWYALAALLIMYGVYKWLSIRRHEESSHGGAFRRSFPAFVIGVVALVAGITGPIVYPYLPTSLQISQLEVRPSWRGTFVVGQKVFSDNGSLFGTGPNTFQSAWGKFKPSAVNQTDFWSTDFNTGVGFVPTSFVTAGALGMLVWSVLLIAFLLHMLRFFRNTSASDRSLHVTLIGATLFVFAFHIFYTPTLAVSLLFFFFIGLSIALTTVDHASVFSLPLRVFSVKGIMGILLLFLISGSILFAGVSIVRAAVSDLLIQKSAFDFTKAGDIPRALSLIRLSLQVNPQNDRAYRAAVELGLLQLQKLIAEGKTADAGTLQATLSDTIKNGLAAVSIDSGDYQNWLSLATLYQNLANAGVEGAHQNAREAYEKAAATNPTNPLPLLGAGQVALSQGDATSSISYLNAAILLKPNLAVAYFLRSQAEGQMGNFAPAIDDAKAAVSLAQQDPLGWYNLGALLYLAGNYQLAAEALSQAISLNNNYSNALFVLALAHNRMNDHQRALAAMQRVVELNPNNETASSTLASLIAASSASTAATATTTKKKQAR